MFLGGVDLKVLEARGLAAMHNLIEWLPKKEWWHRQHASR